MKRIWWLAVLGFALAAWAGWRVTLWYIPHQLMQYTYARWEPANRWHHAGRETGARSWVPMGNPDFIISRCAYDLREGPLELTGEVPQGTYWSLTMYQDNSTNFFLVNDQGREGKAYRFVLAQAAQKPPGAPAEQIVESPTARGYLVVRIFLNPDLDDEALRAVQEKARVAVWKP